MDCRTYQNALRDLAAETISPAREAGVRAHLETCADCRDTLAAEKMLFQTVDAALKEEINTAVPAGFATRIRAAARREADRAPAFSWRMPALAALGVAGIAFVLFIGLRGTQDLPRFVPYAAKGPVAASPAGSSEVRGVDPRGPRHEYRVRSPRRGSPLAAAHAGTGAEVLVPAGEEEALRRWIEQRDSGIFADKAEVKTAAADQRIEIAPLEVAQLKMKPLEEDGNGRQAGTGRD